VQSTTDVQSEDILVFGGEELRVTEEVQALEGTTSALHHIEFKVEPA
jgi:hypothetical protein